MFETKSTVVVSTPRCTWCDQSGVLQVPAEGYEKWLGGELIQVAFPELPAPTREQLKTGIHPDCWADMFA